MSDVQLNASANLDVQQVLAAFRLVVGEIGHLKTASQQLTQAQVDYGNKSTKVFKEVGALIGKIPGLGKVKEVFESAGNGSELFSRLGAGLAVATAGFLAYDRVIQANIDRTKQLIEAQRQFYDISQKTKDMQDSQAKAGLAQNTTNYRKAFATGGQQAVDDAVMLEKTGNFSHEDSVRAVAELYSRFGPGKATNEGLGGLINGSRVGIPVDDMLRRYTAAGQSLGVPGAARAINSTLFGAGRIPGQHGTGPQLYDAALARSLKDPYLQAAGVAGNNTGSMSDVQREMAVLFGGRATGKELSDAADPGMALQTAAFKDNTIAIKNLTMLMDANGPIVEAIMDLTNVEGGYGTRIKRLQGATGDALFPAAPPVPQKPVIFPFMGGY